MRQKVSKTFKKVFSDVRSEIDLAGGNIVSIGQYAQA